MAMLGAGERKVRVRRDRYSHSIQDALKDQRREQAKARQAAYDKLTLEQKIALLDKVPGEAKKQRAQFEKLLAERAEVKPTVFPPTDTSVTEKKARKGKKTVA